MGEFLQNYWLWILLIGIFFAMHRFGMGCGGHGGYQHGGEKKDDEKPETAGGRRPARRELPLRPAVELGPYAGQGRRSSCAMQG